MTYLEEINHRFLEHLRADIDESVELGMPDHLHRLGDPSLDAHWQSVDAARELLGAIDESRAEDFYDLLRLNQSHTF